MWVGHVQRMSPEKLTKQEPDSKRQVKGEQVDRRRTWNRGKEIQI